MCKNCVPNKCTWFMVNSGVSQGGLLKSCLTIQENESHFRDLHSLKFVAVKFQEYPDVGTFAQFL